MTQRDIEHNYYEHGLAFIFSGIYYFGFLTIILVWVRIIQVQALYIVNTFVYSDRKHRRDRFDRRTVCVVPQEARLLSIIMIKDVETSSSEQGTTEELRWKCNLE